MNSKEVASMFPAFLENLEGVRIEEVLPPDIEGSGAWQFRAAQSLPVLCLFPESNEIRVTVGLAAEIPYAPAVAELVNTMNRRELVFGRMFVIGPGDAGVSAVLMQEIVRGDGLTYDFMPSLQNLLRIIGTLAGQADRLALQLIEQVGGRLFRDDEAFIVMASG